MQEKQLLRRAFKVCDPTLLPEQVLWRRKEAFSDGVSSLQRSWYQIIDERVLKMQLCSNAIVDYGGINIPTTYEQVYYRTLYDSFYPDSAYIVPYFWMPNFVNAKDCSARTLDLY